MSMDAKAWFRAQAVSPGVGCDCEGGDQYIDGLLAAARDPRVSDGFSPADFDRAAWHMQAHLEEALTDAYISVAKRQAALEALSPLFHNVLPRLIENSVAVEHFWQGLSGLGAYPEIQFAYLDALGAFLLSERTAFQVSAIRGLERCRLVAERTAMLDDFLAREDLPAATRERANAIRIGAVPR